MVQLSGLDCEDSYFGLIFFFGLLLQHYSDHKRRHLQIHDLSYSSVALKDDVHYLGNECFKLEILKYGRHTLCSTVPR